MDMAKGKDRHKVCWFCGNNTMKLRGKYYECANCGATYNDIPELSHPVMKVSKGATDGGTRGSPLGAPE